MSTPRTVRHHPPGRGMAALTVVLALFFVMALVAAYTNRNLVFEQRMSAGSVRSDRAFAAAEAGVDWAVAMINSGRMDNACQPSANAANDDFRRRFVALDTASGSYGVVGWPSQANYLYPGCQINGTTFNCVCPTPANRNPDIAGGTVNDAAFRLSFLLPAGSPRTPSGTVLLQVRGCANSGTGSTACYKRTITPNVDAIADVRVSLGLLKALPVPPVATLTAGTTVSSTATLTAANPDNSTGLVVHAGQGVTLSASTLTGPAGSAATNATTLLANDGPLNTLAASGQFFQTMFGMPVLDYRQQPAVVRVPCPGGACTMANLEAANWLTAFPGKTIWVDGDLAIDATPSVGDAGTTANPLMLVVNGRLTVQAGVNMVGFVFARNIDWNSATATLRGAMVAEGAFTATADATMTYDAALLELIRLSYGSFVRVPGSWSRGLYE